MQVITRYLFVYDPSHTRVGVSAESLTAKCDAAAKVIPWDSVCLDMPTEPERQHPAPSGIQRSASSKRKPDAAAVAKPNFAARLGKSARSILTRSSARLLASQPPEMPSQPIPPAGSDSARSDDSDDNISSGGGNDDDDKLTEFDYGEDEDEELEYNDGEGDYDAMDFAEDESMLAGPGSKEVNRAVGGSEEDRRLGAATGVTRTLMKELHSLSKACTLAVHYI